MKEFFTPPVCELILFGEQDVITTSYEGGNIDAGNKGDDLGLPSVGLD